MSGSNTAFRSAVTSSTSHIVKRASRRDFVEHRSSSRHLGLEQKFTSTRIDYSTATSSRRVSSIRNFGSADYLDPEDRYYLSGSVIFGGSESSFFSGLEPTYTSSRISLHNQQYEFYFSASNGRTASENKLYHLPYSSSLVNSEFESLFTTHTGLTNLAYAGCKEDGTTAPQYQGPGGQQLTTTAVEIIEVNPYSVTTSTQGDSYLDTEITDE
jgi:hypothetical protein